MTGHQQATIATIFTAMEESLILGHDADAASKIQLSPMPRRWHLNLFSTYQPFVCVCPLLRPGRIANIFTTLPSVSRFFHREMENRAGAIATIDRVSLARLIRRATCLLNGFIRDKLVVIVGVARRTRLLDAIE